LFKAFKGALRRRNWRGR